jgi:endonuclease YncB( thermonuclease family)
MSELVFGKEVELHPHSIDRHGRLVAVVYVNGTDAGLELLKEGLCWVYEKYVREAAAEIQTSYRDAQDRAQAERTGLWQDPDPVPPWEWRRNEKERTRMAQDAF